MLEEIVQSLAQEQSGKKRHVGLLQRFTRGRNENEARAGNGHRGLGFYFLRRRERDSSRDGNLDAALSRTGLQIALEGGRANQGECANHQKLSALHDEVSMSFRLGLYNNAIDVPLGNNREEEV